jgi:hypothetical protein
MSNEKTCGNCIEYIEREGWKMCRRLVDAEGFVTVRPDEPQCSKWVARVAPTDPPPTTWLPGKDAPKDGSWIVCEYSCVSHLLLVRWKGDDFRNANNLGDSYGSRGSMIRFYPIPPTPEVEP